MNALMVYFDTFNHKKTSLQINQRKIWTHRGMKKDWRECEGLRHLKGFVDSDGRMMKDCSDNNLTRESTKCRKWLQEKLERNKFEGFDDESSKDLSTHQQLSFLATFDLPERASENPESITACWSTVPSFTPRNTRDSQSNLYVSLLSLLVRLFFIFSDLFADLPHLA